MLQVPQIGMLVLAVRANVLLVVMQLREVLLGLGRIARGEIALQLAPVGMHVLAILVQVLLGVVQGLLVLVDVAVVLLKVMHVVPNRVLIRLGLRMGRTVGLRMGRTAGLAPQGRNRRQPEMPTPRWIASSCYAPRKKGERRFCRGQPATVSRNGGRGQSPEMFLDESRGDNDENDASAMKT